MAQSLAASGAVLGRVLEGTSLTAALAAAPIDKPPLRAAARDLACKALREYGFVDRALAQLLAAPVRDAALRGLLLAALAELMHRPQHAHATVHQAVEAAALLGQTRAKGLVNAVLRSFQRRELELRQEIESIESGRYRHPQWWIDRLRAAYPDCWQAILLQAQAHPPMSLRVNTRRTTVEGYLRELEQAGLGGRSRGPRAVVLDRPCRVELLPGFEQGHVSVQDVGAQLAAPLLDVSNGMRVLDACAAPGGKCAHLLELSDCDLTAVDIDPVRVRRIEENLDRLGLQARVLTGDALAPESFSAGMQFDRILLDAPCTASGVVRRHPDIRWLRRASDVDAFARIQGEMTEALWRVLAPDGKLLYATCSVFPRENEIPVRAFLDRHPEAERQPLPGLVDGQVRPDAETDGFFYALLKKRK
ncbi:MAG: 16S rRNA (cytosine(967)-C(5))-methyltransferase RsmB [Betaproteobacteria bacterium]|nr:16S rRNA (cytosine(967)-C(5))-methyltransferase RsmB [Betaproteobacteria bacterium]